MTIQWNPKPQIQKVKQRASSSGTNIIKIDVPAGKIWRVVYLRAINGTKDYTPVSISGVDTGTHTYLSIPFAGMVSSDSELTFVGELFIDDAVWFYFFDCDANDVLEATIVYFEGIKI